MRRLALCAFATMSLVAAGCGKDDKSQDTGAGAITPKPVSLELSGSKKNVTMKAPATVEAGLAKITLTNSSKTDGAGQLLRIEGNHTAEEVAKASTAWGDKGKPLPDWLTLEGGTGNTQPGTTKTAIQQLQPGNYLAFDIESDASAPMKVTAGQSAAPPPVASRIDATEYSFIATGLKAGNQTVLFDNKGKQPHFIVGAPLNKGKTLADVRKAIMKESGPPPFDQKAGFDTAVIDGGRKQLVEITLQKGNYAFLCFVPDRQGGPPHVAKGMISEGLVE